MKKLIIMLGMAVFCTAVPSAFAEGITKSEFAQLIAPIVWNGGELENVVINDVENPSEDILAVLSLGLAELDDDNCFEPNKPMTVYELTKGLADAWEIRMGSLEPAVLGGYLSDYSGLSAIEKRYADKAVMLGIVPERGKLGFNETADSETAKKYVGRISESMQIMSIHGDLGLTSCYRDELGITGTPKKGEKVHFYASLNEKPDDYDKATVITALYDGGRLVDVVQSNYNYFGDFTVMHNEITIPENDGDYKVKSFVFDGLEAMCPIYEYKLIR